jgi:hypothetical protein
MELKVVSRSGKVLVNSLQCHGITVKSLQEAFYKSSKIDSKIEPVCPKLNQHSWASLLNRFEVLP